MSTPSAGQGFAAPSFQVVGGSGGYTASSHATKPLFVPSKETRFLDEFFLYVLEGLYTCGAAGASTPAREAAPVPSDDEGAAELITLEQGATDINQAPSPTLNLEILPTPGRA